jgi:hypothetical protein
MAKRSNAMKRRAKAKKNLAKAKLTLSRFNKRSRAEMARHTRSVKTATKRYRAALRG